MLEEMWLIDGEFLRHELAAPYIHNKLTGTGTILSSPTQTQKEGDHCRAPWGVPTLDWGCAKG